jgi:signal transduction histidine kinase/ligand-binding sensor domain-containing protein
VIRRRTIEFLRHVALTLETCLFLALACSFAYPLDPFRTIAQFAHTSWGPKEGAPSVIRALAQTADGYLWLASPDGLYRFDGVVFEHYQPPSSGSFPSQDVASLLALPNGDLWVGFRVGAISVLRNGNVTNYTVREGMPNARIWGLAQDREGTIWAATEGGLARLEGDRWRVVGANWNFPESAASAVFVDNQETLWVASAGTLMFLPAGTKRFEPTGVQVKVGRVLRILQAPNGKLWMADLSRSVRPVPLTDRRLSRDDTEIRIHSTYDMLFDKDGALWIGSEGGGVYRTPAPESIRGEIPSTAIDSFTTKDGLTDNVTRSFLQDREGNVWVGTNTGLDRFSKTSLVPFVLPFKTMYPVLAPGDAGNVWFNLVPIEQVHKRTGDYFHPSHFCSALSAYRDPGGAIWWFCIDAIYRYKSGRYLGLPLPSSIQKPYGNVSVAETMDGHGAFWLAVQGGLFYWKSGSWHELETNLGELQPRAAFTDALGRAWFGYEGGTIIVLDQEKIQMVYRGADSPVGEVKAINGRRDHIWVGGESGLAYFDGIRLRRIVPADADAFGAVLGIQETLDGSLWLVGNKSVIQVPASQVQQALSSPSNRVTYRVFDSADGVPGTFAGTTIVRKEIQGTDGRLWFGGTGGVVWVDPANVLTNTLPPPISIRSVRGNGQQVNSLANLVLAPQTTTLQIDYTALSLVAPERVRFRYILEGVDKEWQDASTRREAFYTKLGPGHYHFHVIACNNDGVWNEDGAGLDFSIAPTWYQTNWFRFACVVAFLTLMWRLYQLRVRQLQRQFNIGLEARVNERTRIARELHDTLLQSFHGLLLRFQAASNLLPTRPDDAKKRLDAAIDQGSQAIAEGRDAVQGLRPPTMEAEDLAVALRILGEELNAGMTNLEPPAIDVSVEGEARRLRPLVRDEVYRISGEALRNAFRHAQAKRIETEIRYGSHEFRVRIRDDGKGMEIEAAGAGTGHFGLPGMRERAKVLGANLEVWSNHDSGTEVQLTMPASKAYETYRRHKRFRFFGRAETKSS